MPFSRIMSIIMFQIYYLSCVRADVVKSLNLRVPILHVLCWETELLHLQHHLPGYFENGNIIQSCIVQWISLELYELNQTFFWNKNTLKSVSF